MTPDNAEPRALTAAEFFARGIEGCSVQDAHFATRIAYSTIHRHAKNGKGIDPPTAMKLQQWSHKATGGACWISAARTLGLSDPVAPHATADDPAAPADDTTVDRSAEYAQASGGEL